VEGFRTLCGEGEARTYYMFNIYARIVTQWAQIVFRSVKVEGIG